MEKTHKTIRFKARCGITATWRLAKVKEGFKVVAIGKAKVGRNPIPLDFAPFEIMDAVYNRHNVFPSTDACEAFAREH